MIWVPITIAEAIFFDIASYHHLSNVSAFIMIYHDLSIFLGNLPNFHGFSWKIIGGLSGAPTSFSVKDFT